MGRWAQAERRGGGVEPASSLGPPPPPLLAQDGTSLNQTSTGGPDTGGGVRLQYFIGGEDPWMTVAQWPITSPFDWSTHLGLTAGIYRVFEVGGGVEYVGVSGPSEEVDYIEA